MPELVSKEIYERNEDGTVVLKEIVWNEVQSMSEKIKEKEELLLKIYEELQKLKEENEKIS